MSVTFDLLSVQRRVDAIAGVPVPLGAAAPRATALLPQAQARFGNLVAASLDPLVQRNAAAAGVDPALIRAVIGVESGGNPSATSGVGAAGLMQLMPQTAQALGVANPYDPAQNVRGGATYLRQLLDRFRGEVPAAVAAYNAGPGAVERFGGIPPYAQTQTYVARVMDAYRTSRPR